MISPSLAAISGFVAGIGTGLGIARLLLLREEQPGLPKQVPIPRPQTTKETPVSASPFAPRRKTAKERYKSKIDMYLPNTAPKAQKQTTWVAEPPKPAAEPPTQATPETMPSIDWSHKP